MSLGGEGQLLISPDSELIRFFHHKGGREEVVIDRERELGAVGQEVTLGSWSLWHQKVALSDAVPCSVLCLVVVKELK